MEQERDEIVKKIKNWLSEIGNPYNVIPDPKGKDIYIQVDRIPDRK